MKSKSLAWELPLNFLFLFFLLYWISGGLLWMPTSWHEVFNQKPSLHRILTAGAGLGALAVYYLMVKRGSGEPFIISFFKTFPLSHKQWVAFIFLLLGSIFTVSSWIRHDVFHTSFDMAIFVQAVWNTAHGNFLYSSIKGGICLLRDHFSPLLAVLALPYRFWPDPKLLLLLQGFAAASCVFPLDQLARLELKNKQHAFLMILAFALYLPLRNAIRFDFHPEVMVMPLLLLSFVRLMKGRLLQSSLCLLAALSAKENVALVTFAVGFYAAIFRKEKFFGISWMLFSLVYFFAVIKIAVPYFAPSGYFYLDANYLAWKRFGLEAFVKHLASLSSAAYLVKIFAPVGFLSFLNFPVFLLTLPMLAQNLVARNEEARSIFFQYTALLTPFVFISAIYGAKKVLKKEWGAAYLLIFVVLMSGVSEYYVMREHQKKHTPHFQKVRSYFKTVPEKVSVRTHEFFAPHLANRKEIHIYVNQNPAEGASQAAMNAEYVVLDMALLGSDAAAKLDQIRQNGYRPAVEDEGFYVFIK